MHIFTYLCVPVYFICIFKSIIFYFKNIYYSLINKSENRNNLVVTNREIIAVR